VLPASSLFILNLSSGPQAVGLLLPDGVTVGSIELLRAGSRIPFRSDGGALRFTVPGVEDYEVAAISVGWIRQPLGIDPGRASKIWMNRLDRGCKRQHGSAGFEERAPLQHKVFIMARSTAIIRLRTTGSGTDKSS